MFEIMRGDEMISLSRSEMVPTRRKSYGVEEEIL